MRYVTDGEWVFDATDSVEAPQTFWWWHKTESGSWEVVDDKGNVIVSSETHEGCIDKLLKLVDATPT